MLALLGEVGRQLAVGHRLVDEVLRRALDEVVLAIEEGQPARLVLLDDADLDAIDHRQAAALEARLERLALGIVRRGIDLLVVEALAVMRVALQHHQRAAPPLLEHEGPGAHRMRHRVARIGLDHLARDRAVQVALREDLHQPRPRLLRPELQRVAVERAQALDGLVVVEGLAGLAHLRVVFVEPEQLELLHFAPRRRGHGRIGEALEGVDVVLGRQLPALALEGGIVREIDAGAQLDRPQLVVVGALRQRRRGQRFHLRGTRQLVVGVEPLEHVGRDHARIEVADLGRIEAGLGDAEGVAQHLRRRGRG